MFTVSPALLILHCSFYISLMGSYIAPAIGDVLAETAVSFSSNQTNVPLQINITFRTPSSPQLSSGDTIFLHLPHFTTSTYVLGEEPSSTSIAGQNIVIGDVELYPSNLWDGEWTEGAYCGSCTIPFSSSKLTLQLKSLQSIAPNDLHTVVIDKSNGIKAFCGHAANNTQQLFVIGSTIASGGGITTSTGDVEASSPQIGAGCLNNCTSRGRCDFCYNVCICDNGYRSTEDVTGGEVSADCSKRTCPWGNGAPTIPISPDRAHTKAECSNNGLCNEVTGECNCFPLWEGSACERRRCPNDCSGHGVCATMRQLSTMPHALPLAASSPSDDALYGSTIIAKETVAWDYASMQSCVCDSDWSVGLGSGQVQEPQWFLPDCSRRRCPSGDDPDTPRVDETDCSGKVAKGGQLDALGESGNLCYVECSNRGTCVYDKNGIGRCRCFPGYLGDNCGKKSEYFGENGWKDPAWQEKRPPYEL